MLIHCAVQNPEMVAVCGRGCGFPDPNLETLDVSWEYTLDGSQSIIEHHSFTPRGNLI